MKNMKKYLSAVLALVLLVMALAGCGSSKGEAAPAVDANGNVEYKVILKDALGNAYHDGIIVKFSQNGQETAMQVVDANGVAAKAMPAGEYTVELVYTNSDADYSYTASSMVLTAAAPELEIQMANSVSNETQSLYVDGKDYEAYHVSVGCTLVPVTAGDRSYFLFTPEQAGTYEFSVVENTATVGYYGAPHFVQTMSAVDVVDNKMQISVSTGNLGGVMVIGLDSTDVTSSILLIERIGEAAKTIEDEPWILYKKTVELKPYTLPSGAKLRDFDLTAASDAYDLVLNEADGFYHLDSADGPLVLVRLAGEVEYLDSYKTILEHTGVVRYFFDDNGDFVKREQYGECLLEYIANVDENNGVYPLTEDLKYIIQNNGIHQGWWELGGNNYIFMDEARNVIPGINADIAWLFMCCYVNG